ncbi:carbon-nitrogen hydrolase family protein [Oceanospirillum sediminis]|uniref:Carbon-nitrogen hydrolase family protein n=1 Tax=Oceanospirillum sediminis TaxID=2760088 RepID=A0A839IXD3_9GAMM|nr:carbon-nitrogen hydrolase family protein [Oceanospirillum sediminis]MBB1489037.1 carbon-nitrogen hydrolase family protein [Oceanospirillum sediminis]
MQNRTVTFSLVQSRIEKADYSRNLQIHLEGIKASAEHKADVVVFPELSLTGYELPDASRLALVKNSEDQVFRTLSQAATEHNLVVVAGCPIQNDGDKPFIGAVICFPNGRTEFYLKQYLHEGEDQYCSAADQNYQFDVNGYKVALAVCADFQNPMHSEDAATAGSDIYLVSALITGNGYAPDGEVLSGIASRHQFPVLLSNYVCESGGLTGCGKSAMWDQSGKQMFSAEGSEHGLVLCTISHDGLAGCFEAG